MSINLKSKVEELFGIDLRSLALFRICIALLIITDLILRLDDIQAFYSDEGLLPRTLVMSKLMSKWHFSFHLLSGLVQIETILFLISGLFAVAMLIGYRTKLVTFISLIFMISLHMRSEIILDSGDQWLRLILFWSLFLPLGAYYSVDSALNSSTGKLPKQVLSAGTIALIGQFILAYLITILQNNLLISETNAFVLWLWVVGPLLIFVPLFTSFVRVVTIIIFFIFNLGIYFYLDLGSFPLIGAVSILLFLPSEFWDKLFSSLRTDERLNLKIYYDGECGFCKKTVLIIKTFFLIPETQILPAQNDPPVNKIMQENNSWVVIDSKQEHHIRFKAFKIICSTSPVLKLLLPLLDLSSISTLGEIIYNKVAANRIYASKITTHLKYEPILIPPSKLSNALAAAFLIYVILFNFEEITHKVKLSEKLKNVGSTLYINQWWNASVNNKGKEKEYAKQFEMPATLKDGTKVNLFEQPIQMHKNRFWAKYILSIKDNYKLYLSYLAMYQCRIWNNLYKGEKQIEKIEYYDNNLLVGEYNCPR